MDDRIDTQAIQAELAEPEAVAENERTDRADRPVLGAPLAALRLGLAQALVTGDKALLTLRDRYPICSPAPHSQTVFSIKSCPAIPERTPPGHLPANQHRKSDPIGSNRRSSSPTPPQHQQDGKKLPLNGLTMTCPPSAATGTRPCGSLLKTALGAAAAMAALSLSPGSALAAPTYRVKVGQLQYDVTYFTGSYVDNSSRFNSTEMPWWGSDSEANNFAAAVGTNLGTPFYFDSYGPYFASSLYDSAAIYGRTYASFDDTVYDWYDSRGTLIPYATASLVSNAPASVPAPLPIFGAGAAFGFSRKLRKRIQVARRPQGSRLAAA